VQTKQVKQIVVGGAKRVPGMTGIRTVIMKRTLLVLVIMAALAATAVGGTLAGWSDTEESQQNYLATGDMDLKVAQLNDGGQNGIDWRDDLPWEMGLNPCFIFTILLQCPPELVLFPPCSLLLWNAGSVDGMADIHFKVEDWLLPIADHVLVTVWYDTSGDGFINYDTENVVPGIPLSLLDCTPVPLGNLLANEVRPLEIQLDIMVNERSGNELMASLENFTLDIDFFNTMFSLLSQSKGFSDFEECTNLIRITSDPD